MRALRSCLSLSLLFSLVLGGPLTSPGISEEQLPGASQQRRATIPEDTYQRYVSNRCNQSQILAERVGWAEAGILADALNKWVPESNFQNAMNMYMGHQSTDTGGIIFGTNYRKRLQDNINRQFKLHSGQAPSHTYTYIYCDEDESPFRYKCPEAGAYTWSDVGRFWTNHMVVLCPEYFRLPTMSEQLRAVRNTSGKESTVDNLYANQGQVYFHENMHFSDTVGRPDIVDVENGYGPVNAYRLALYKDAPEASINSDSYTITALAMFLMQDFSLNYVPIPNFGGTSATPVSTLRMSLTGPWAERPQNPDDENSRPDMTKWQLSQPANLNRDDYSAWVPGGNVPRPSAHITAYASAGDCTGDSFTWKDASGGCFSYSQAQKMYSVYVDNPIGNNCAIWFYSDASCTQSAQMTQFTNMDINQSECQKQASTGFLSFTFQCSQPR